MKKRLSVLLKLIAAIIMLQTLFFKFSGAQQSIELFTKLAGTQEAFLRVGTGVLELIAALLLFTPKNTWLGALLTMSLMGGAMLSHIAIIGIVHNNDGGILFAGAAISFLAGLFLLLLNKQQIPYLRKRL